MSGRISFIAAPLFTIVLLATLGILYYAAGIAVTGWRILLSALAICVVPFFIKVAIRGNNENLRSLRGLRGVSSKAISLILIYVAVSFFVAVFLYVLPLDGPGSYMQTYDNVHHYGLVQSFLSSGEWSSLRSSLYLSDYDSGISPFVEEGGYYPSSWHVVVAMISSIFKASVPFSSNVVNVTFLSFVYPIGMLGLMMSVFRRRKLAVWFGAVCVPAFSAFPWVLLLQWPLYPNFVSMSLLPIAVLFFIEATRGGCRRVDRFRYFAGFSLSIFAFYFAQPNSAFSAAIILIPYCVWRCSGLADILPGRFKGSNFAKVLCSAAFIVFAAAVWVLLYKAPFLQGIVNFQWDAVCTLPESIEAAINLSQNTFIPQRILAIIVFVGFVGCLFRGEYCWISFAYAMFAVIFVVSYGSEGALKHFLAGFWYTDYYRIAATMAVIGVPVAAYGLCCLSDVIAALLEGFKLTSKKAVSISSIILGLAFGVAVFIPVDTNVYSWLRANAENISSSGLVAPFDRDEQSFVDEARRIAGDGELLLNQPYDGSMYSFGADGTNLYYRYISGYGSESETAESRVIRERLCDVAFDAEVQDALAAIKANYVLDLGEDEGILEANPDYDANDWRGIEGVSDNSPGFEIVLECGDMRLYKIVVQ